MTLLDCAEIERQAAQKNLVVQEEIENRSQHLAEILCGEPSGPLFETLAYAIREIIRNVAEHSKAPQVGVCAQVKKNRVEVAIVDRGSGCAPALVPIPTSMRAPTRKR